ncbi:hypothetical protein [Teredinibacter sp. KSP-S5-2]|uniref:hypothetical protein n=1 Tax=Teredinibacter sp. KSP-S5-2 TaxID=3034506 RepID=UPI002934327D|nr:hypothetical protein [Teredinibacter sp. KSP-S5-2]WNO08484.1 hypothetical protein P5V12_16050 [Teredinibacter sp. KSP-S5-2]
MNTRLFIVVSVTFFLVSCGGGSSSNGQASSVPVSNTFQCLHSPIAKGERLLGMDYLNENEQGSFEENVQRFKQIGGDFTQLHITWSQIESAPNQFVDPDNILASIKHHLETDQLKLVLVVRPIDVTGKTVPDDLTSTRFNAPVMAERFTTLLDYVLSQVGAENILSLHVGNEIDGYDTRDEHQDFWSDYGAFLFAIKLHMQNQYPEIKLGFTATWGGIVNQDKSVEDIFTALLSAVDILGVTYYPIDENFMVRDAASVHSDIDALVQTYPDKPIFLTEVGMPSSGENQSSERAQARFFCEVFKMWDDNQNRIPVMDITRMNDLSLEGAEAAAGPYGLTSVAAIEYLRTLGFRTFSGKGQAKEVWAVITEETNERGW